MKRFLKDVIEQGRAFGDVVGLDGSPFVLLQVVSHVVKEHMAVNMRIAPAGGLMCENGCDDVARWSLGMGEAHHVLSH